MGAAGDMLTAALLELLPEYGRVSFLENLNAIGLPGVKISSETVARCGITGTHIHVAVHGHEEGSGQGHSHEHHHGHEHSHGHHHEHEYEHHHDHEHHHNHHHEHEHEHHHASMNDVCHIISHLHVSDKVKSDVINVYKLIAEAESVAHGKDVSEIHFHEVGMMDAICDVTAVCMLIEKLNPKRIIASPVHVGCGRVKCAHGILPVPAPATAYILRGIPCFGGEVNSELCTPTGAALIKYFVNDFGPMPVMFTDTIGYGAGTKDFPNHANVIRAMFGTEPEVSEPKDSVYVITCTIDDMTGEEAAFALDRIFVAGALDAFYEPIIGKKSRPGYKLTVLSTSDNKDSIVATIFKHTSTIGLRYHKENRHVLERRTEHIDTCFGPVAKKISYGYGVEKQKWEYDDVARIADHNNLCIEEVISRLPK